MILDELSFFRVEIVRYEDQRAKSMLPDLLI